MRVVLLVGEERGERHLCRVGVSLVIGSGEQEIVGRVRGECHRNVRDDDPSWLTLVKNNRDRLGISADAGGEVTLVNQYVWIGFVSAGSWM